MNILISLVSRIASGEKLEKGTRSNTAYWLSSFALIPIGIFGAASFIHFIDSRFDDFFTLNPWILILSAVILCLILMALIQCLSRLFMHRPVVLLLMGIISWGSTFWYVIAKLA